MIYFCIAVLVLVGFLIGRYQREKDYESKIKAVKEQADWWRGLYEKSRPSAKPENPPGIQWEKS